MEIVIHNLPIFCTRRLLTYLSVILFGIVFICCAHVENNENQSTNYIFIKSTPTAKIFVDGNFLGMTPNSKIPVNSHSLIQLKADGYQSSLINLGEVKPKKLIVKKASGHGRINISSAGLTITMKVKQ